MASLSALDAGHAPTPQTDREYLVELYRLVTEMRAAVVSLNLLVERQNGRVRALEQWQARLMGILAVIGTVAVVALGVAGKLLLDVLAR